MPGAAPHLADDKGWRAAFQRLLHRPQQRRRVGRAHENQALHRQPQRRQPRPVQRASLARAKIVGDDERARPPRRRAKKARADRQREAHRRRAIAWGCRGDLMQPVARQPAAQRRVKRMRQRQPERRARAHRPAIDRHAGNRAAQMRYSLRPADPRHQSRLLICSLYVLVLDECEGESRAEWQATLPLWSLWPCLTRAIPAPPRKDLTPDLIAYTKKHDLRLGRD